MERALIETIFFEQQIAEHPTTQRIRRALPRASWVPIDRYQELFNKRHQNFKLQKKNPALILAKKYDNFVLPVPSGFGMDSHKNFYFSHMYNCLYYCVQNLENQQVGYYLSLYSRVHGQHIQMKMEILKLKNLRVNGIVIIAQIIQIMQDHIYLMNQDV